MPYIKTIPQEEATDVLAQVYARQRKNRQGRLPESKKLMSLNPNAMKAVEDLREAFFAGSPHVDARRREMIAVVTSSLLKCKH